MKEMPKQTHLVRRGAVYYYRGRVPTDIQNTYRKKEEFLSLKTRDYQEALKLVRKKTVELQENYERHRREQERLNSPTLKTITKEQLKLIYDTYYIHLLEEDEETRLYSFYDSDEEQPETPLPDLSQYQEITEALPEITRFLYAQGKTDEFFKGEAEEVLSWDGIELNIDDKSLAFKKVIRELQKATIRAYESIQKRNEGSLIDTPELPQSEHSIPVRANSNAPLLSTVVEEWVKDKSSSWKPDTKKKHHVWANYFIELTGDRPIDQYNKSDVRAYKKALLSLPSIWQRKEELQGLTIKQAVKKSQELNLKPRSEKTAKDNLSYVSSLWRWMLGHYDEIERNIFEGITIKVNTRAQEARCRNVGTSWTLRVKRKHMEAHHDKNRRKRIEA